MAKKITDLTAETTPEADDYFPFYEDSSGLTKKIKYTDIQDALLNDSTKLTATATEINTVCDADENDPPIVSDGTAGRVIRHSRIKISAGTGDTVTCQLYDKWNGDAIASQTDIPDNGTLTGGYKYYALSSYRYSRVAIDGAELSALPVAAFAVVSYNSGDCDMIVQAYISVNDIFLQIMKAHDTTAAWELDENLSSGYIEIDIIYITAG